MAATVLKVWRDPLVGDQLQSTLNTSNFQTDQQQIDQYRVMFSDSSATPAQAEVASDGTTSIPAIGSQIGTLTCNRVFPKRNTSRPDIFEVQVEWKNTIPAPPTGSKWNINISVTPSPYTQDVWQDVNKKPILNSAGQTFNPTLKRTWYDDDIKLEFDAVKVDTANIDACKGHYNAAAITMSTQGLTRNFAANTLLFLAPGYSAIITGSPPYDWHNSYYFKYRPDGWLTNVPDRGYFKVETVSGKAVYTLFTDKIGQPHGEPILMNGKGDILPPVAGGGLQTPVLINFDLCGPADFSGLLAGIT